MNFARAVRPLLVGACWQAMSWTHAAEPKTPAPPPVPTIIESEGPGEMTNTEKESTFTFRDKVVVTGTNLRMTCDLLVVVARRTGGDAKTMLGKQERFKSFVATGNVHIVQGGREAYCERAEIFPDTEEVVLTGNPLVRMLDGTYEASSDPANPGRMILRRGEQKAIVERARIKLPELKDLGFEKEPEKKKSGTPAITLPKADAPK